jgi:ribosomal protein S18 acetylase RimI-like enzyme
MSRIVTTPFERQHQPAVDDLLFHSYQVHTHLDWFEASEWLNRYPVPARLAWQGERLEGVMAVSHPLNGTSWLRVAALHDYAPAHSVMAALWESLLPELRALAIRSVSVLITRNWISGYLRELEFGFVENVVTLERSGTLLPNLPDAAVTIRPVQPDDIQRITQIDQLAFPPPWQMSLDDIQQAYRIAAVSTVAERNRAVVGYQLSTLYRDGAHLARLAVDPTCESQGIGSQLVLEVIQRFLRRRISSITVNTQASNLRSQHLYQRFSFRRNGYDLPVWQFDLLG